MHQTANIAEGGGKQGSQSANCTVTLIKQIIWGAAYLIIEPFNVWQGGRTLLMDTSRGDWRPLMALFTGCLICGFFWEMWNFYSYPRWIYHILFVDFLRIFEMPLLGYLGYLPFSMELFALYHLITGLLRQGGNPDYIHLTPAA